MNPSHVFDAELHEPGTPAAEGRCSHHTAADGGSGSCTREAVVSFQDAEGQWQAGCSTALEQLVEKGEIEPLGQGA